MILSLPCVFSGQLWLTRTVIIPCKSFFSLLLYHFAFWVCKFATPLVKLTESDFALEVRLPAYKCICVCHMSVCIVAAGSSLLMIFMNVSTLNRRK